MCHDDSTGEQCDDSTSFCLLTQQIAQLDSKLKHEKTQRLAILNDIVDIDLNALFDRLITEDTGDEAKKIIDRLKDKVCENVHDFESYSGEFIQKEDVNGDMKQPTLYARQEEWVKRRDQKRFEAKMQLEAEAMRGVTGRPELGDAKRSWVMAKEAHEVALEKAPQNATPSKVVSKDSEKDKGRELKVIDWEKAKEEAKCAKQKEEAKQRAKEEKDNAARMEEIKALETGTAVEKTPTPTKERPKRPEAMRKSSVQLIEQTRRRSKLVQQEEIFLRSKSTADNFASGENNGKTDSNINAFTGVSYAEMSEKEFKKLVRSIAPKIPSCKKGNKM